MSIRLTSLALWQCNDCPSASRATLMNMDKYFMWIHYERLRNHNKAKHNKTMCIFLGIYCRKNMYLSSMRKNLFLPTEISEIFCIHIILAHLRARFIYDIAIHYTNVTMGTIASQITSLTIVYSTVYSDADQRKYQNSVSLSFVRGIHWRLVNSPHKWPVTWNMFSFDDVIMICEMLIQM